MSLLESYNKNKKKHLVDDDNKHLLKEVSVAAGAETHAGRAGDHIDRKFAGPFHPEFAQLKKLLKKQVEGDIIKRMWTDDITPIADQDFIDMEYEYGYDEASKPIDNSDFINKSKTNMEYVGVLIDYDNNKPIYDKQHRDEDPTDYIFFLHELPADILIDDMNEIATSLKKVLVQEKTLNEWYIPIYLNEM